MPYPDLAALLATALGTPPSPDTRLAIAVSGGPDSLALIHLAATDWPGRITAITVDHGLRKAAAEEAKSVAEQCLERGIPHVTLRWAGPHPSANIQAEARAARYKLMGNWCAANATPLLLTAHHADDQAETLLMRLARGSGLSGLAGIRAARPLQLGVTLVRPLLSLRRAALAEIATNAGWKPIQDPSNIDERYDRVRMRSLLAATPALPVRRIAEAAAHLAEAEAALEWAADRAWAGRATVSPQEITLDTEGLPAELARRLLLRALLALAPQARPRGADVARLMVRGSGTLLGIKASGGPFWHLRPAPQRRLQKPGDRP